MNKLNEISETAHFIITTAKCADISTLSGEVTFYIAGSGDVRIYWCGICIQFHRLKPHKNEDWSDLYGKKYRCRYAYFFDNTQRTITISGGNITHLSCRGNEITSLLAHNCPALEMLDCGDNQLTALDVCDCPALNELDCSFNQLSATALDALFETLRNSADDDDNEITIHDNPGAADCNRSIAEGKDWTVIAEAKTFEEICAEFGVILEKKCVKSYKK